MKNKDYIGTEINGIIIIDYKSIKDNNNRRRSIFTCMCHCKNIFLSRAESIKNGYAKSCGCKTSELQSLGHIKPGNVAIINAVHNNYIYTAKRKNIIFLLTFDEFKQLIFNNCVYCGSAPKYSKFSGSEKWKTKDRFLSYNGIDRVDNNIGYIVGNCVTCCSICNRAKSDLNLEEFKFWIKQMVLFINESNNVK